METRSLKRKLDNIIESSSKYQLVNYGFMMNQTTFDALILFENKYDDVPIIICNDCEDGYMCLLPPTILDII